MDIGTDNLCREQFIKCRQQGLAEDLSGGSQWILFLCGFIDDIAGLISEQISGAAATLRSQILRVIQGAGFERKAAAAYAGAELVAQCDQVVYALLQVGPP